MFSHEFNYDAGNGYNGIAIVTTMLQYVNVHRAVVTSRSGLSNERLSVCFKPINDICLEKL